MRARHLQQTDSESVMAREGKGAASCEDSMKRCSVRRRRALGRGNPMPREERGASDGRSESEGQVATDAVLWMTSQSSVRGQSPHNPKHRHEMGNERETPSAR
jgi:hypothetical protein